MKIQILPLSLVMLCAAGMVSAETIHLKDGRTVTGKVIEKSARNVKATVNGVTTTYYADEIKDIDGVTLSASAVAPSTGTAASSALASTGNASTGSTSSGPVSGDKKALIMQFIDVFGTKNAMQQNLAAMMETLPSNDPQSQKIKESIKVDEIIAKLVPLYDRQFTAEDLKAFIAFYSSPQGKKLVESIPIIMRDSVEISAKYFQEKFPELNQETAPTTPTQGK